MSGAPLDVRPFISAPSQPVPPSDAPSGPHSRPGVVDHAAIIALLGGAQALILVAGLLRWKIIALFLGPSGVGIAGIIDQAAQVVLQLGALNIPTAALRFLAIARQNRGAAGFAGLYRAFLRMLLSATAIAAVGALMVYLLRPGTLGVGMGSYRTAVIFALVAVPLTGATNLLRNVLATLHRHRTVALILLGSSALLAASTVLGLRVGGLGGAYLAAFIVAAATVSALHGVVKTTLVETPGQNTGALLGLLKAHPDIVRFSITLYAVGFAVPLGYSLVRWTVLGQLGIEEAGFLAAAYTVAAGLRAVFSAASTQYLIPLTSRDLPKQERATEVARYIRTLALLLLVAALPLLLFPHELLVTLYSRKFISATDVIGIFILAEIVMAIGDAYRVLQLGFNDLIGYFMTTCGSVVVVAANITWVVAGHGLLGAALLQVAGAAVALLWSIARIRSRHGIAVEWRSLALIAYVLTALTAAVAVGRAAPEPGLTETALKAIAALCVAAGAWFLMPRSERVALLRSIPFRT